VINIFLLGETANVGEPLKGLFSKFWTIRGDNYPSGPIQESKAPWAISMTKKLRLGKALDAFEPLAVFGFEISSI